jgi:hypothetical protein
MEDMSVFFDPDGGAVTLQLRIAGEPDIDVVGILGAASKNGLEGYAIGVRRELRYPASAVQLKDKDHLWLGVQHFIVRGAPELENDGQELVVQLSEVSS